jgi:hypothetical protein
MKPPFGLPARGSQDDLLLRAMTDDPRKARVRRAPSLRADSRRGRQDMRTLRRSESRSDRAALEGCPELLK